MSANGPEPAGAGRRAGRRGRSRIGQDGADRLLKVEVLARVEGEGALDVKVRDGVVSEARLRIYEPPRFFEAFLRGRTMIEVPDLTARICGICPVAYQMSAVAAIEQACGVEVGGPLRALRRLLYCGEWLESHGLHVVMLHAPDFLGYESGIHMARDHGEAVTRGLQLKKVGNELMALLGGREVHPISVRPGGFWRVPTRRELQPIRDRLLWARDAAIEMVRWVATFPFPAFERDYVFVAVDGGAEYPMLGSRIRSTAGLDIPVEDYDRHFEEEHVRHSNALYSRLKDGGRYHVGPMARYALAFDRLAPIAQDAALQAGLGPVCRNPFQSIIVRAVEMVHAADESIRIIDGYEPPDEPAVAVPPRAAAGHGVSEAPRGLLYHRYALDAAGLVTEARIVPPTSQNQAVIEEDLSRWVETHLDLDDERLTWTCEQTIRNYDPCISCATHFLRLTVDRGR